jgi:hypothetical protein
MADITAINYYRPKMMVPDGRGCTIIEKAAIPASTVIGTNDTVSFAMPAGVTVHRLRIHSDDIDAGTAMVFRAGYLKQNSADTLTADDDYFAAAGQTLVQAGGGLTTLSFHPIKFEIPWILRLTFNTGGTSNASVGYISVMVGVNMNGVEGTSSTGLGTPV